METFIQKIVVQGILSKKSLELLFGLFGLRLLLFPDPERSRRPISGVYQSHIFSPVTHHLSVSSSSLRNHSSSIPSILVTLVELHTHPISDAEEGLPLVFMVFSEPFTPPVALDQPCTDPVFVGV